MNKYEFISSLEKSLYKLPKTDRDDILSDYEAHFAQGLELGKTEEEICAQLGDPAELAAVYLENAPQSSEAQPEYSDYTPPYERAYTQNDQYYKSYEQAPQQPYEHAYQYNAQSAKKYSTENLIIYILLMIFVVLPIAGTVVSVFFSIAATVFGMLSGAVALLVGGIAATVISASAGIGVMFLGAAVGMLAALLIVGLIAAVKGIIKLVDWFVRWSRSFITNKQES